MMSFQSLHRWWGGLSLLYGLLLIHALIYAADDERGRAFWVLLGVIAILTAGVGAFTLALTPARLDKLRRWITPFVWIGVVAGWGVLFVFGLELRPEWVYAQMGLTLAATLILGFVTMRGMEGSIRRFGWWVLVTVVAGVAATPLRIAGLGLYPPIQVYDEGWGLGWAVEYNRTGVLSNRLIGYPQDHSVVRLYVLLAYWVRLVGAGLWEARLFFLLLTLVVIVFSTWAALNLYGRRTASCTAIVLFCSVVLSMAARIRHDIGLAIAVAISLWLYSEALKRERVWLHGLAGLAMGWGAFGHYNTLSVGSIMVISLYGPRYVARLREGKRWPEAAVWFYGLGGIIAALHVTLVQVWPAYSSEIGFMLFKPRPSTPIAILKTTWRHVFNLADMSQLEFILVGLGVGAALWRRQIVDWSLILLALLVPVGLGLTAAGTFPYYPIQLTPLFGLLIGSLFGEGFKRTSPDSPAARPADRNVIPQMSAVAVIAVMVISLGYSLSEPLRYVREGHPLRPAPVWAAQWVLNHVEPGATVVGEHYYYLWLLDYDFVSPAITISPAWYTADKDRYAGMSWAEIWDTQSVDVFIIDPALSTWSLLQPLADEGYFESRGYRLAAEFDGIRIYYQSPTH